MNAEMLSNMVDVEMICDQVKYSLTVSRVSKHIYALIMNNSCLEVDLHKYITVCVCNKVITLQRVRVFALGCTNKHPLCILIIFSPSSLRK